MRSASILFAALLTAVAPGYGELLKAAYDQSGPAFGYDRYMALEPGATYTGGLWLGGTYNRITATFEQHEEDVCIAGNGAILDLQGQQLCIAYCNSRLDIEDCIIVNGGVTFRGFAGHVHLVPAGSVRYVTFYRPPDYGIRLFGAGADVLLERNIVVDPIDTGPDFMFLTGIPSAWLPTGAGIALSLQASRIQIYDNWTWLSDPDHNADPLRHFAVLCDYG